MYSGVMVYCNMQDKNENVGFELVSKGHQLAGQLNEPLYVAIACEFPPNLSCFNGFGIDKIFVITSPQLKHYTAQSYAKALYTIVSEIKPSILLMGATTQGRDLAPRLAAQLDTGLTADCTQLGIDGGLLLQTRPAYGGNVEATILCSTKRPQMATVRSGVFCVTKPLNFTKEFEVVAFNSQELYCSTVITSSKEIKLDHMSLSKADIIVTCGRGVKNEKGVALVQELADILSASVGATRGVVEDGLLPRSNQVGQTGQTVRPRIYIACGLSGAAQHLAGMHESGTIIAINSDANALIFKVSDYGICGDIFTVIPNIINQINKQQ